MPSAMEVPALLWTIVSDALDIPRSLYEKAADRHTSLGEWLCRPDSALACYQPSVHPQGSFRYGTVVRSLVEGAEFDIDQVVVLRKLRTGDMSQRELKGLFGAELIAYANAHCMQAPAEKHRCWRLKYRDEVPFHLDSLPCVPADSETYHALRDAGVDEQWALRAVAITDDRHPSYSTISANWLTSNPRGFARWFEARAALGRRETLISRAPVEDVPPYAWRTPLQRSIQVLKRHRDVMYRNAPDLAPISMIITNLAAHAYAGQTDLTAALTGIVERMGNFVRDKPPRVPNPTHPDEDYADKWNRRSELEHNFWLWLEEVRAAVRQLSGSQPNSREVERRFAIQLTDEDERRLRPRAPLVATASATSAAAPRISSAPKPWGHGLPRE